MPHHFIRYRTTWLDATTSAMKILYFIRFFKSFILTDSCKNILQFEDTERIPGVTALSYRRSRKACNLLGSVLISITSFAYSKLDSTLYGQIPMSLFSHEDKAFSVDISMTKLNIKVKVGNLDEQHWS